MAETMAENPKKRPRKVYVVDTPKKWKLLCSDEGLK